MKRSFPKASDSKGNVACLGEMMEQNESDLRDEMETIYVNKSKQIINSGRMSEVYKNSGTLLA